MTMSILCPSVSLSAARCRSASACSTSSAAALAGPRAPGLRPRRCLFYAPLRPGRRLPPPCPAGSDGTSDRSVEEILASLPSQYATQLQQRPAARQRPQRRAAPGMGNGVFTLLLLNFGLFAAQCFWNPPALAALPLSHWAPRWWQFITASFMHANADHLMGNAFSLLIFGRMVEEEEGGLGVWATYLLCGAGGCLASLLTAPHAHTVSLGASAAVFGLFAVAVLSKMRPSLKQLLESAILGSFVAKQVLNEVKMASSGGVLVAGMQVGHAAHLAGACMGVLLVALLSRLPRGDEP